MEFDFDPSFNADSSGLMSHGNILLQRKQDCQFSTNRNN